MTCSLNFAKYQNINIFIFLWRFCFNVNLPGLTRLMELKLLLKDEERQVTVISSRRLRSLPESHEDLRMLDQQHGPPTNTSSVNVVFDLSNETAYARVLDQVLNTKSTPLYRVFRRHVYMLQITRSCSRNKMFNSQNLY